MLAKVVPPGNFFQTCVLQTNIEREAVLYMKQVDLSSNKDLLTLEESRSLSTKG